MGAESYITWNGKEENEEPQSREDIVIILAHGHSRTMSFEKKDGEDEANIICMSEVVGGWTKAFEALFENQNDPEFVDQVCSEVEQNLIDETKNFVDEIMAIFEHFDGIDCLPQIAPLIVEIEYFWTSENRIKIELRNDFRDKLDQVEDFCNVEDPAELKKWLDVASELYLIHGGKECCERWETFINMNFNEPEKFRELVEEAIENEDEE